LDPPIENHTVVTLAADRWVLGNSRRMAQVSALGSYAIGSDDAFIYTGIWYF